MTTITVDAAELQDAAPPVQGMHDTLAHTGHGVGRAELSALPARLAARVQAELSQLGHELVQAAAAIEHTARELRDRAGLANAADQLSTLSLGLSGPELTADLIKEAHEADKAGFGVPDKVGTIASRAGRGLVWADIVLDFAVPSVHDVTNPYLDDNRKKANVTARAATTVGILVAGGVAAGLVSAPLLAVGAAAGTGLALRLIDKKLAVTEHLADGINAGLDAAAPVSDEVDAVVGDAVDKAKDVAGDAVDKAKDVAGGAVDKAKDVAGGAVDKVGGVAKGVAHAFGF